MCEDVTPTIADERELNRHDCFLLIQAVATGCVVEMLDANGDHIGYRIAR